MELFWFIPTHGDGRYLATGIGGRSCNFSYLKQIAQAVDRLGFTGALLPTGRSCEDAWVVASSLMAVTEQMRCICAGGDTGKPLTIADPNSAVSQIFMQIAAGLDATFSPARATDTLPLNINHLSN